MNKSEYLPESLVSRLVESLRIYGYIPPRISEEGGYAVNIYNQYQHEMAWEEFEEIVETARVNSLEYLKSLEEGAYSREIKI